MASRSVRESAARLDLAGREGHRQIGDRRILALPAAVAGHRRILRAVRQLDGFDRLGQSADLVDLDQNAVGDLLVNPSL